MVSPKIGFVVCVLGAALLSACDSSATTPTLVENVSYVTNVYTSGTCNASSPGVVITPTSAQVGIPACDAFFSATELCVRSITSDAVALSRFEGRVQSARAQAIQAEASGDPSEIARATSACKAAADAYRLAPCG